MRVHIDESLRSCKEVVPRLEKAISSLQEEINGAGDEVTATWSASEPSMPPSGVLLKLSYEPGEVAEEFSLAQLREKNGDVQRRIRRLWSTLLDVRVEKQLQKVEKMILQLED